MAEPEGVLEAYSAIILRSPYLEVPVGRLPVVLSVRVAVVVIVVLEVNVVVPLLMPESAVLSLADEVEVFMVVIEDLEGVVMLLVSDVVLFPVERTEEDEVAESSSQCAG